MFLCMYPGVKWVNVSVAVVCDRVYITDALHQSACAAQPEEHLAVICSNNLLLWVHIRGTTSQLDLSLCQGREGYRGPCFCSVGFCRIPDLLRWHIFSHTLIEIHKYMCHMMYFFLSSVQPRTHTCSEKLISISAPTALMCYLLFTQDWLLLLGIVISVHLLVSHLHFYVPLLYHKEWELTHKKRELAFWHRRCFKMVYGLLFSHCIEMDSLLSHEN